MAEQCVLAGRKPKKAAALFLYLFRQHRNPNLPRDLFSPSSYQESFTLSGMD